MDKKAFGKYIKSRREALGLTQQELADLLYVDATTLSGWERGRTYPDIEMIRKLCEVFETSLDDAMEETDKIQAEQAALRRFPNANVVAVCILAVILLVGTGFGIYQWNKGRNATAGQKETTENTTEALTREESETNSGLDEETAIETEADTENETETEDATEFLTWDCTDGVLTISGTGAVPHNGDITEFPAWSNCGATKAIVDCYGVKDMSFFFWQVSTLREVEFGPNFDTSETVNMDYFFCNCYYLTDLDMERFDTSHVQSMHNMFWFCAYLTELDLSGWDTSSLEDMSGMFNNCYHLKELDLSGWDVSKVDFEECPTAFYESEGLRDADTAGWDEQLITQLENDMEHTEGGSFSDGELTYTFEDDVLTISGSGDAGWFDACDGTLTRPWGWCKPKKVVLNCNGMTDVQNFLVTPTVEEIEFGPDFDSSKVTCFYNFLFCDKLESLDTSAIDTSSATDLCGMFGGCASLKTLDLSGWDVSKVEDFSFMFENCQSLSEIDFANWDVSSGKYFVGMFYACSSLSVFDLSEWEAEPTATGLMFEGCVGILEDQIPDWYHDAEENSAYPHQC